MNQENVPPLQRVRNWLGLKRRPLPVLEILPIKKPLDRHPNPFEYSVMPIPLERALKRPEFDTALSTIQDETNTLHSITVLAPPRSGGSSFAAQIAESLQKTHTNLKRLTTPFFAREVTLQNLQDIFQEELTDAKIQSSDSVCIVFEEIERTDPTITKAMLNCVSEYVKTHPNSYLIVVSRNQPTQNISDSMPPKKIQIGLVENELIKNFIKSRLPQLPIDFEDYIVAQSGGHIGLAQRLGSTTFDYLEANPRGSLLELQQNLSDSGDDLFTLFAEYFTRANRKELIEKWFKDIQSLSSFDQNRFPRPTSTLFKEWVEKKLEPAQQTQDS